MRACTHFSLAGLRGEACHFETAFAYGLEAATGTGRRFWDKPIAPRADGGDEAIGRAQALAERLRAEGHATAADRLHHATAGERLGHALLEGLREACQTVLTTIEALDPKTQLMAEELRLEIDKRLSR